MYRTVQMSSCISAQGELVETLGNGEILVRDGDTVYKGRPVVPPGRPRTAPLPPLAAAGEFPAQPYPGAGKGAPNLSNC